MAESQHSRTAPQKPRTPQDIVFEMEDDVCTVVDLCAALRAMGSGAIPDEGEVQRVGGFAVEYAKRVKAAWRELFDAMKEDKANG